MPPRKRLRKNANHPPNLYSKLVNGSLYFYYRRPDNGKTSAFGTDKKKAFDAAMQLNQILSIGRDLVAETLAIGARPFSEFIDIFLDEILPSRCVNGNPLSESTLKGYRQRCAKINELWGYKSPKDITLKEISEFLDSHPSRMSNVQRATLCLIWKYMKAKGLVDENLPEATIPKDEEVKRKPLTLEAFNAVRQKSPQWFKNAMDLALESLQSRAEIASAQFSNIEGDAWRVIRKKTKSHGISARLEIKMWPQLKAVVARCRNDVASPYIVHKRPEKNKPRNKGAKGRTHPTQVMAEGLSRRFAKSRSKTDFFEGWSKEELPTFHEIRALGADLKRKQGWPEDRIQKLMAHSDKEMTAHYLDKHEMPWTRIEVD